ncbi:MAG: T9SS type A sorting domain-containing protein [Calditrichaeota bacterium]|nr:T9SS type A sorting domain-containing protein [Calditrichota bacterium]
MKHFSYLLLIGFLLFISTTGLKAQTAAYDTVTIYDIQHVTDPAVDDQSPLFGDTVIVKGLVMHYPRELYVGSRWAVYVVDPDSFPKPWSGFFIIQHDTTEVNTLFGFVEPGMICNFTGVVDEYSGLTQLALLTDPVVPVEIISTDNPLPEPLKLTSADLSTNDVAEQWESMWVYLENGTIVNNSLSSNTASVTDESGGLTYLDDYFWWFRSRFNDNIFSWPPAGTKFNVKGFTRHVNVDLYTINPRTDADLEILSNPPVVTDVVRTPGVPTPRNDVIVTAKITDNTAVAKAILKYSVNGDAFVDVEMQKTGVDTFSAKIPNQTDGSFVRYFIYAEDDAGDFTTLPGDTSFGIFYYVVRMNGLSVKDVQYTWGYPDDASGYAGYQVTLKGIVTSDSSHFSSVYYIQEKEEPWYGIQVRDVYHNNFAVGDEIQITGTIEERYGVTRIVVNDSATGVTLLSSGNSVTPMDVTTGEIATGGDNAEAYESCLVRVKNLTVTNPFPDGANNFGEFMVSDGSGDLRVDDYALHFRGNLDSTFALNDHIDEIVAIHYYSYGNYKLIPRSNDDIHGHTDIERPITVTGFELKQNFPNPFNPTTTIEYNLEKRGNFKLSIYNILGQHIRTLVNGAQTPGLHKIKWDGRDDYGKPVSAGIYFYSLKGENIKLTKKMLLIK